MTKFLFTLSIFVARLIATKEEAACASNADYKLVIKNRKTQECVIQYFFTVREAIEYASPPNLFLGDGYDYFIYHRLAENKEQYVKLYNSKNKRSYYKQENYYGSTMQKNRTNTYCIQ